MTPLQTCLQRGYARGLRALIDAKADYKAQYVRCALFFALT